MLKTELILKETCRLVCGTVSSKIYVFHGHIMMPKKRQQRQSSQWLVGSLAAHSTRERHSSPFLDLEPAASLHSSLAARSTHWCGR